MATSNRKVGAVERAALRTYGWLDERFRVRNVADKVAGFYFQLNMQLPRSHTEKYKIRSIWYWYPMYTLGSLALLAFIIATITGILLTFWYVPSTAPATVSTTRFGDFAGVTPSQAWVSVATIMYDVPFGFMIRAAHFWSAMVMVAAVFLHMMRVYWTQAYKKPRELNWLIGFLLIILTLGLGYTGYLLPWSQLSYWAGTIGNEMASASPPPILGQVVSSFMFGQTFGGQQTISRMYILHVILLPLVTYAVIGLHITIVWIQGIAEPH
ncbi:MAG: cytochrome b [Thermoplasmatota archaeon]